jgi:hypothetical protein
VVEVRMLRTICASCTSTFVSLTDDNEIKVCPRCERDKYKALLDESKQEIRRLQESLWALGYAPWTEAAPGLWAYVRNQVVSGVIQFDQEQIDELDLKLGEDGG